MITFFWQCIIVCEEWGMKSKGVMKCLRMLYSLYVMLWNAPYFVVGAPECYKSSILFYGTMTLWYAIDHSRPLQTRSPDCWCMRKIYTVICNLNRAFSFMQGTAESILLVLPCTQVQSNLPKHANLQRQWLSNSDIAMLCSGPLTSGWRVCFEGMRKFSRPSKCCATGSRRIHEYWQWWYWWWHTCWFLPRLPYTSWGGCHYQLLCWHS